MKAKTTMFVLLCVIVGPAIAQDNNTFGIGGFAQV